MTESKAKTEASKNLSLGGEEAADLWNAIQSGWQSRVLANVEGLPRKPQNCIMFVTNSKGETWSVKIMEVYKGEKEWHLTCRWAESVWTSSVSPEVASTLGVSW